MKRKLSERLVIISFSILFILCIVSFYKTQTAHSATTHLVISEVQIAGTDDADKDFIEIYNPTSSNVNLNGYKLVKRSESGVKDSSIKSWNTETIIPAGGYYLWANDSWTPSANPDATTGSALAANNGIALRQGALDTGTIIDSIAWGTATNAFVETAPFPTNPGADESIERSGDDTNNNSVDFFLQTSPNPQNSGAAPTTTGSPTPTPTGSASPTPTASITPTPTTPPATSRQVVINEIAWAGTIANPNGEWIELYNNTESPIDLTGWTIIANDGSPNITLAGTIPAKGYFLLERTSDDNISGIAADQIYTGVLENDDEGLELKNSDGTLIDAANSDGGEWPGGDNGTKASMERKDPSLADTDDNWWTNDGVTRNGIDQDGNNIQGTPKAQNSGGNQVITPTQTPTGTASPTPTGTVSVTPTQKPASTATPTPTLKPTLSPTPSPTPTSAEKVIATFSFPGRTVTCSLSFKIRITRFFIMLIPKITCK